MKSFRHFTNCILVLSFLAVTTLAGCSFMDQYTPPQKVTIEKKETPTPSAEVSSSSTEETESTSSSSSSDLTESSSSSVSTSTGSSSSSSQEQEEVDAESETLTAVSASDPNKVELTTAAKEKVVAAANHRLDTGYYSRDTLIAGLLEDGFTQKEAEYGADNCYVSWG